MTSPTRVSVKGVVLLAGRAALLMNERDDWELPGGRLEPGEEPETCVVREIAEELGLVARDPVLLDVWLYRIPGKGDVLIVTYGVTVDEAPARISDEHRALGLFTAAEMAALPMPEGYRRSIRDWMSRCGIPLQE
ncbi:MAG: NUDIX hydrolase [Alphaproteobacteria bacterium]|jgi:8-oxo-dGTP pyrophosphatase MutT (NUDIX family)|nr:NUDIX hydrolase [Alphaproteobacteria bacterium]